MKPIQAQFVQRRGPSVLLWGLLLSGLLAVVVMQYGTHRVNAEHQAQWLHMEQLAREEADAKARAPSTPVPFAESLKEIERLREVPWPQLLAALEAATRKDDVRIDSIGIDVVAQRADVAVAASSAKAVLDYVGSLNEGVPPGVAAWRWGAWRVAERSGGGFSVELRATWSRE